MRSLMVIKEGDLMFVASVFKFAAEWGEENGLDIRVGNTPDGMYEILDCTVDNQNDNENTQP